MSCEWPRQAYEYISMSLGRSQLVHKRVTRKSAPGKPTPRQSWPGNRFMENWCLETDWRKNIVGENSCTKNWCRKNLNLENQCLKTVCPTTGANPMKLFWCKFTHTFCKLDHFLNVSIIVTLLWRYLDYKKSRSIDAKRALWDWSLVYSTNEAAKFSKCLTREY